MKNYTYISLKEKPELLKGAAKWFSDKWNVEEKAYEQCMSAYLNNETEYGWYLCLYNNEIVAGLGVIENDFHKRVDLLPNICAVYTLKQHRCQGIAGVLLSKAVNDLKIKGISPVYLVTNHVGFYEKYDFEFVCMVECDDGELSRLYRRC